MWAILPDFTLIVHTWFSCFTRQYYLWVCVDCIASASDISNLCAQIYSRYSIEDPDEGVDPSSTSQVARGLHYIEQAALMKENDWTTMYVDYAHVTAFDTTLADNIAQYYGR